MPGVFIRPRARRDLNTIPAYYIETAGANVARRFRLAAAEIFRDLNAFPSTGVPARVRNPRYRGTRMWRVKGFGHYLVFMCGQIRVS
ncbi:MAG: type II toxin-antitoxin system RelE/ParE family toxin [Acidobacteriota bacterium]